MSSKEFCESGKHIYKEIDIVESMLGEAPNANKQVWIVVGCQKCDSKFLREVERPLP